MAPAVYQRRMTRCSRDSRTGRYVCISIRDGNTQLFSSGLSVVVVDVDVNRSVILYSSVPKSMAGVAGDVDDIDLADGT